MKIDLSSTYTGPGPGDSSRFTAPRVLGESLALRPSRLGEMMARMSRGCVCWRPGGAYETVGSVTGSVGIGPHLDASTAQCNFTISSGAR